MSVSESQTNVVYKVDDHTGPLVDVKKWLDDQEPEAELNLKADKLQVRVGVCSGWREECVCVCVVCVRWRGPHETCVVFCLYQSMWCCRCTVSGCTGSSSWSDLVIGVIGFLFFRAAVEFLCTKEHTHSTTDEDHFH